ncbi:MAG TPA: hypothetical protein VME47_20570 [Acetobacteraceae bacterium]|nr:hypothetical protein [Acetobacteraceae bacterium]
MDHDERVRQEFTRQSGHFASAAKIPDAQRTQRLAAGGGVEAEVNNTNPLNDRRPRLPPPCHCEERSDEATSVGAQTSVRRSTEVASSLRSSQ